MKLFKNGLRIPISDKTVHYHYESAFSASCIRVPYNVFIVVFVKMKASYMPEQKHLRRWQHLAREAFVQRFTLMPAAGIR